MRDALAAPCAAAEEEVEAAGETGLGWSRLSRASSRSLRCCARAALGRTANCGLRMSGADLRVDDGTGLSGRM